MAERWFCKVLGREMGPLGFEDLVELARSGTLTEGDPVRREGSDDWAAACEVAGLFELAECEPTEAAARVSSGPPEPAPALADAEETEPSAAQSDRRWKRGLIWGAAVGVVVAAVAAALLLSRGFREPDRRATHAGPAVLEDRFTQDFREQFTPQALELVGGRPLRRVWKAEAEGLRFTLPGDSEVNYYAVSPRIVVKGDFEITAAFTVLDLPRPSQGFGAGLKVHVEDLQGERAAIQRLHRQDKGHVFASYRGRRKEDDTYEHSVRMIPVKNPRASSGWLRLRRDGTKIEYHVAGAGGEQFTKVHEEEFPAGDVAKLRLDVQTGGSPTAVDVLWTFLEVRAERLDRVYQPPEKPKIWRTLIVVLLAILLVAGLCLAVWLWLARRAYFRPAQPVGGPETT